MIEVGSRVKLKNFSPVFNGSTGTVHSFVGKMIFVKLEWRIVEVNNSQIDLDN